MKKISTVVVISSLLLLYSVGWSSTEKPLSVSEVAAKPDSYLGKVVVVGRVAAVNSGKGFTLIDSVNCASCTDECLLDKKTKKLPLLWAGKDPATKSVVRVHGILAKSAKGFALTAEKVAVE